MECGDDCPAGRHCSNKRFQKMLYARDIIVAERKGKGCGLVAAASIPSGTFIIEYVGKVLSPSEMARRIERQTMVHYYFMTLNSDQVPRLLLSSPLLFLLLPFHSDKDHTNFAILKDYRCL